MYRSVIVIAALLTTDTSARSEGAPTAFPRSRVQGLFFPPLAETAPRSKTDCADRRKAVCEDPASNGQMGSPISNTRMTTAYKSAPSNQYSAVEAPSVRLDIAQCRLLAPTGKADRSDDVR